MVDLVGRWSIVSWERVFDDGRRVLPMGDRLTGFIQYDPDGHMAVMIAGAERAPFDSGGLWDASEAQQAAAYRSMLAYAGRYEIRDDTVLHHVDLSLYPNWTGGVQVRRMVAHADGTMTLQARVAEGSADASTASLVWRRADGGRS